MKPDKGNNKKNAAGLVSLILWALLLVLLFKSCSSYADANQVQVEYSIFRQWVTEELVESVQLENGKYIIALKEGCETRAEAYLPEQEDTGNSALDWMTPQSNSGEVEYVTTPPPLEDAELIDLMTEHGVMYYTDPVDNSSYFLSLLISTVLPVAIMVAAMMFLFRGIGGKGGMGGLGGLF